ncbi:MAG: DUF488 family protein [Gammaproteobacteria bacterium]|nr:DUF488 family protein [Gammaproteobacteria bacterium]
MPNIVYTIGHSTHSLDQLTSLLAHHAITAIGDVRSRPYSRTNPQFNREPFKSALKELGIAYVFLGSELGARSDDPACYGDVKVSYEKLARSALFRSGLQRVRTGAQSYRLALMCAEKEPLDCHRTILVARHLEECGLQVQHILADGSLEKHSATLERLIRRLGIGEDLFKTAAAAVREAYEIQEARIAYKRPGNEPFHPVPAGATR